MGPVQVDEMRPVVEVDTCITTDDTVRTHADIHQRRVARSLEDEHISLEVRIRTQYKLSNKGTSGVRYPPFPNALPVGKALVEQVAFLGIRDQTSPLSGRRRVARDHQGCP